MRAFIAFDLPGEIKAELQAAQAALREIPAQIAWTKPDNFHLTLKFFAELNEAHSYDVIAAMKEAGRTFAPFNLQLGSTGVFPNTRQPRVLWVGLQGQVGQIVDLHTCLNQQLAARGFESEARGFRPHLTLGRLKSQQSADELVLAWQQQTLKPGSFIAGELKLIRSELHPSGSRYTTLATVAL